MDNNRSIEKKKVLFVAYQFVPLSVGGSYRPYQFAIHLKKYSTSIEPIVLRLSPDSYENVFSSFHLDEESAANVKEVGLKVYDLEAENILPKSKIQRFLSIYFNLYKGNEKKSWENQFNQKFLEIVREEKIDLVWVTGPPFGILELVRKACSSSQMKYIADLRDNWSLWLSKPHANRINYWLNRFVEKRIYKEAAAIVGVTQNQLKDLQSLLPAEASKFHCIPNSFDSDLPKDFTYSKTPNQLTIAYAGSFYFDPEIHSLLNTKWYRRKWHRKFFYWPRYERWIYRSPYFFFKTMVKLKKKYPSLKLKLELAGNYESWLADMVKHFGLEDQVMIHSYMPKPKLREMFERADSFLLTSMKVEGGEDYCIASKSFEYLKEKKMIIGMVAEGAQKQFLSKSGNHLLLDPDNLEDSVSRLAEYAALDSVALSFEKQFLSSFQLKNTSQSLEDLMLSIIKES